MGKLIRSFVLLLFWASSCFGASYYICDTGNDVTGDGTSGTPWATIAKAHLAAGSGDTIFFCSQGTWSGTPPIIVAEAGVIYYGDSWGSGTRAKLLATADHGDASRSGIVDIYQSTVTFKGFEVTGETSAPNYAWITGGIYIGTDASDNIQDITVDSCVVHDIGGAEGADRTPPTATNYVYGIILGGMNYKKVTNTIIQNNTVYNIGHEGLCLYPSRGYIDPDSAGWISTALIRNNTVYNTGYWGGTTWGSGIDVGLHSDNVTVEFNTVYNSPVGLRIVTYSDAQPSKNFSPDNTHMRYNLIFNNTTGFASNPGSNHWWVGNNYIYGNIFYENEIFLGEGDYNSTVLKIYNNTLYMTESPLIGVIAIYETATETSNIEIKNNIVNTISGYAFYDWGNVLTAGNWSNNLFYKASGNIAWINATNYTAITLPGLEATTKVTDPSFTGGVLPTGFSGTYGINMVPNTTYFYISSGDAINNGATLGAPYNDSINAAGQAGWSNRPIGAGYDIGAYEYGAWPNRGVTTGSFSGSIQ